jgi:hypothetical protein
LFGFCSAGFSSETTPQFLQVRVLRVVACDQRKRGSRQNVGSDDAFAVMLDPRRIARAVSVPSSRACFITCGRNDRQTLRQVKGLVSPHQGLLFTRSIYSCHPISPSSTSFHGRSLLPHIHPSFLPEYCYVMGASNLFPLVVLFAVVGGVAYVGYQVSIRPRTSPCVERLLTRARTHRYFYTQTSSPSAASTSWRRRTLSSPRTAQKLA